MLIMKNLVIISIVFLFISCNKNNPKPNEKFYCQVDGKAFRTDSNGDIFNSPLYAEWNTKGWFSLYADNFKDKKALTLIAKLGGSNEVELLEYSTPKGNFSANYYGDYIIVNNSSVKESFAGFEGKLTITKYDKALKLVSGTFEFKAKSKQTGTILNITKGQFNDVTVFQVF